MAEEYGVTSKGFVLMRYDTILSQTQSDVSAALGFDVSQNPQSMLNSALIVPFCDKIATCWEMLQDVYYSQFPSTAEGTSLDNVCQYENIFRKGNRPTEYVIYVTANDGTEIPKNSLIASDTVPVVQLKAAKKTTITRRRCHAISIVTAGEILPGDYSIEINTNLYTFTAGYGATSRSILEGLKDAINEGTGEFNVTYDEETSSLVITDAVSTSRENDVIMTANLTTRYVVGCVRYNSVEYGDIYLQPGCVTKIVSNVTGMISVTNQLEPTAGRTQESDTELRADYVAKAYVGATAQTKAIASGLLDEVSDIQAVVVYENTSDFIDDEGRMPHSIEVVVDGGNDNEIADVILERKSGGIYTNGKIAVDVVGEYGDTVTIRFNRPDKVYVWVKVIVTQGTTAIDPGYVDTVKNIILNHTSMTIGDTFLSQGYITPIYNALPGIKYVQILVAEGSETVKPDDSEYKAGNIYISQRQIIDLLDGRIEVSLTK